MIKVGIDSNVIETKMLKQIRNLVNISNDFGVHFLDILKRDIFWNLATFKLFNGEELVKIE